MLSEQSSHRQWATQKIRECLEEYEVQPILFIGSGMSQRYFGAPDHEGLLERLAADCPKIERRLNFYKQKHNGNLYNVASEFSEKYMNWAWEVEGEDTFPDRLYENESSSIFLKYWVSEFIEQKQPGGLDELSERNQKEIEFIQEIGPHAIITTNYDEFLEQIFPEYVPIVGEEVYNVNYATMGEIFKIHGSTTDEESLILTQEDIEDFNEKRKYLSAKLLTYFSEHPVIILGHGAEDPNLKEILSDVSKVISGRDDDLISNIFHVHFDPGIQDDDDVSKFTTISTESGRARFHSINAEEYNWVYDAAGYDSEMSGVKIKYLRKLLSNTYDIVSEDAPRKEVQVEILKNASDEEELPKLFGVAPVDESSEAIDMMRRLLFEDGTSSGDPEEKISLATFNYEINDDIISSRERILYFRQNKKQFELDDRRRECLFESSIHNNLFGGEWLIGYEGDVSALFRKIWSRTESIDAIGNLEYTLYLFKEEDLLEDIRDEYASDYTSLNSSELLEHISSPLLSRVSKYYSNDRLEFPDSEISVQDLFGDDERVDELLKECAELLLSDISDGRKGIYASDFRKLELLKLGNSMQGDGLLRWVQESSDEVEQAG